MATNNNANPTPAISFHPDHMATLLVGPEEQKMVADKDHLSRNSALFKVLLREGQSLVIRLEKESPDLVQYYIEHVVYGGRLPTQNLLARPFCTINQTDYLLLAGLFVVGETFLNAKYQNEILQ